MTIPLFTDSDERKMATTLLAALMLPSVTIKCDHILDASELVNDAFIIADAFIAEAERRYRSTP